VEESGRERKRVKESERKWKRVKESGKLGGQVQGKAGAINKHALWAILKSFFSRHCKKVYKFFHTFKKKISAIYELFWGLKTTKRWPIFFKVFFNPLFGSTSCTSSSTMIHLTKSSSTTKTQTNQMNLPLWIKLLLHISWTVKNGENLKNNNTTFKHLFLTQFTMEDITTNNLNYNSTQTCKNLTSWKVEKQITPSLTPSWNTHPFAYQCC